VNQPAQFLGHPRGLATLFFTEMWERFTYYGMRALLVLFLVGAVAHGGFGIDDKTAAAIYGLYTASVYLAALPGGWIADRLIGAQRAVIVGGLLITVGNMILAISATRTVFYLGLVVIVAGVGLLKPNVSTIVADLYPEGGARRDAGFTIFYIGINLGSAIGPLVTAQAKVMYGDRAGFAAAGIFMALGVIQFVLTRKHLGDSGLRPGIKPGAEAAAALRAAWSRLGIGIAVMATLIAAVALDWLPVNAIGLSETTEYLIVAMSVGYFIYYFSFGGLDAEEKRRGVVLIVLFLGSALFWTGYEQGGSSLNLFAERYTDRFMPSFGFMIPTEWFQSLNPVYIMVFAPMFASLWVALGRRNLDPAAPAKFAIGVVLMGLGFLVMAAAARLVAGGAMVSPNWLGITYLLHTFGELCLSPVGLSYYTKLAPKRFVGQMMGIWFLSISFGNLLAGRVAGEFDASNLAAMPGQYMHIVYFSVGLGLVLLALAKPVKNLMGDIDNKG
jgi:POT family proton-dependent oligopeptide transporter